MNKLGFQKAYEVKFVNIFIYQHFSVLTVEVSNSYLTPMKLPN